MRAILAPNEAVAIALNLVKEEMRIGLSAPEALSIVAGRKGIDIKKLKYFYNIYNLEDLVEV